MTGRYISLINIPSPYRVHFFKSLKTELEKLDWSLEVYFMAKTEKGRFWRLDESDWTINYRFGKGIHPRIKGSTLHFNPDLIASLRRNPPGRLLVCGGWFTPTILFSAYLTGNKKTKIIFWNESNLRSTRYMGGIIGYLRRKAFSLYNGFVVPGDWAKEYLVANLPGVSSEKIYVLPNVVDEEIYHEQVKLLRQENTQLFKEFGITSEGEKHILLSVARLEPIKGVIELLKGIARLDQHEQGRLILLVAGEGYQRYEIEQLIVTHDMSNVKLLGHLDEPELIRALSIADGFVLPSLRDPSPLAAIEAAFAGLPLILSENVGNHPELLVNDENGWLFNPNNIDDIVDNLRKFINTPSDKLQAMGKKSLQIAKEKFSIDQVVKRFAFETTR